MMWIRGSGARLDPMTTLTHSLHSENNVSDTPLGGRLDVILPSDARYDTARLAWNLTADQHPAAIWKATAVRDVQDAVVYARERGWHVTVQTTGHYAQILPDLSDTLLLKLSVAGQQVTVDPARRTARVPSGAVWSDVIDAVAPHGLTAMHGSAPSVGVIGYLAGGGLGFYGRAHGLACNHVLAFDVVTADGRTRHVDADHDPELFYALRGGGGGYAAVTAVEIELLPYAEVIGGAMFFAVDHAPALLRAWHAWSQDADESISTTFRLLNLPPLPQIPEPLRGVQTICIDGVALKAGEAERLAAALESVAQPILGGFGPMPAAAVTHLHGDPEAPTPGIGDGILLGELDDQAIDAFLHVAADPSLAVAELRHLGGALALSPHGAGALDRFDGEFLLYGAGVPGAPAPAAELNACLDRFLEAMAPWASGTRFWSFAERNPSLDGSITPEALQRVTRARMVVDPDGLFIAPRDADIAA
jgi:FAD/FMN-containing dehydrogenase